MDKSTYLIYHQDNGVDLEAFKNKIRELRISLNIEQRDLTYLNFKRDNSRIVVDKITGEILIFTFQSQYVSFINELNKRKEKLENDLMILNSDINFLNQNNSKDDKESKDDETGGNRSHK